jgi:hypothetical protein
MVEVNVVRIMMSDSTWSFQGLLLPQTLHQEDK